MDQAILVGAKPRRIPGFFAFQRFVYKEKSSIHSHNILDFYMGFKRAKIVACTPKSHYRVWIRFDDGLEGEVDLSHLVGQGVFEAWKSVDFFNQVRVDPKTDTLTWGDEIDLDPYVLRESLSKKN